MNKDIERSKCVVYLRVASAKQPDQDESLEKQRKKCHEFCKETGFELVEIFADAGIPNMSDRAGLQHMVGYLNEFKDIKAIVCTDSARLTRSYFEFILLANLFEKMGVQVHCIDLGRSLSRLDLLSSVYRSVRKCDNMLIMNLLDEVMGGVR